MNPFLSDVRTAVITAADHPTGLGAARALHGLGLELVGMCTNPRAPCSRSRLWDRLIHVPDSSADAHLEALLDSPGLPPQAVLFPVQDDLVQAVSDARDELGPQYRFVLPSRSTVDLFLDKAAFHEWARPRGFPVPESHVAESAAELRSVLRGMRYPVVLKPLYRTAEWQARSPAHKAYKLWRPDDVDSIGFDLFEAAPKFVVQQWIEGSDGDVHFCLTYVDRGGAELGYQTGRKLLQWPVQTGSTAICEGTDNAELHELTQAVFQAAEFRGIGSLEVKRSAADRRYYITEATVGRHDLQSYLAVACGVNLTRMAFFDAIGGRYTPTERARPRAVWIQDYFILHSALQTAREGNLPSRELASALVRARSLSFAHFRMTDPRPAAALWSNVVKGRLRRWF